MATASKAFVPSLLRRIIGKLYRAVGKRLRPSPLDVVKSNTKDAFDYFYRQDDFIDRCYLEAGRLEFYELVADYCADILLASSTSERVRVVDVGCGTGNMLEALWRRLASRCDLEMFGLDFSAAGIARAKRLLPMAMFRVEDIYANRLPTDFFDLVLCLETLEHLQSPKDALIELVRVCKPGADIVVTVPNGEKDSWDGHLNFWNVSQLADLLSPFGLADIQLLQDETVIIGRLIKEAHQI